MAGDGPVGGFTAAVGIVGVDTVGFGVRPAACEVRRCRRGVAVGGDFVDEQPVRERCGIAGLGECDPDIAGGHVREGYFVPLSGGPGGGSSVLVGTAVQAGVDIDPVGGVFVDTVVVFG